MEESLNKSAGDGDVEALYLILAQDPHILERVDRIPIVDTPLHIAASAGNIHFAMEIATLKPSLARKLNHLGLSPIHLALQNGHDQLVRALVAIDSELVRVKAKGRVTPLHYVAEIEKVDILAEFLSVCPSAIEDFTVRCETAVHIALKNYRACAFEVLLGWLRRVNKEEILEWKDEDGNTVLHIATSTNQAKVMKLMIKKASVNVNAKNFSGLTAMDIFHLQGDSLLRDSEVGHILLRAKAKRASELSSSTITFADYLRRDLSLMDRRNKYFEIFGQPQGTSPSNLFQIVLVVAILIATATYQAGLSPPGGYWQDNGNPSPNNTSGNTTTGNVQGQQPHLAGQMILRPSNLYYFFTLNSAAFYASVCTILIVITGVPYCRTLSVLTGLLLYAYYASLSATFPSQETGNLPLRVLQIVYTSLTYLSAVVATMIPWVASSRHEKLKRRVDKLKRSLGGLL